jgi:hypothetical protein
LATSNVEIAYNQIVGCVTTGIALAMGLDQITHDNTVVSAGNDAGGRSVCLGMAWQAMPNRACALILLAPFKRLPDDFVLIRAGEMPQKSLANFFVNEHGECTSLRTPPGVQLDRTHFRKYYRGKQRKL